MDIGISTGAPYCTSAPYCCISSYNLQPDCVLLPQGTTAGAVAGSLGAESPLQQALLKFLDAWSLSPDDWELNLHAGRLLLLQGHAREALQHLRTGLALRPSHAPLRYPPQHTPVTSLPLATLFLLFAHV